MKNHIIKQIHNTIYSDSNAITNYLYISVLYTDPLDPLFITIGSTFLEVQSSVYGTDHLYNCDPFNEVRPPTNNKTFISRVGKTIYRSMYEGDNEAVRVSKLLQWNTLLFARN